MSRFTILVVSALIGMRLTAQPGPCGRGCCGEGNQSQSTSAAPVASNPVVDIIGTIGQIQIVQGQGMPYIEVKHANESTRVYLGAIRYLIAENFNPKTGQEVVVTGYKLSDSVVAIKVTLPQENKTLKLRDENGWPLWRGGPWRGGRGRMMSSPAQSK